MSDITDKIDRFGHCVGCGENLLVKRVVNGRVVDMFKPIYDHTIFLLDNGSEMQVTICKKCKSTLDLNCSKVQEDIMEACIKGWDLESKILVEDESKPEWTKERANEYMKDMACLNIDCHSENLDKHVVQNRQFEILNFKVEEVSNVVN